MEEKSKTADTVIVDGKEEPIEWIEAEIVVHEDGRLVVVPLNQNNDLST